MRFLTCEVAQDRKTTWANKNVKRRNPEMCKALKELMKDEIQKEVDKILFKSIKNLMETLKLTVVQAMDALKIPSLDQGKYLAML